MNLGCSDTHDPTKSESKLDSTSFVKLSSPLSLPTNKYINSIVEQFIKCWLTYIQDFELKEGKTLQIIDDDEEFDVDENDGNDNELMDISLSEMKNKKIDFFRLLVV